MNQSTQEISLRPSTHGNVYGTTRHGRAVWHCPEALGTQGNMQPGAGRWPWYRQYLGLAKSRSRVPGEARFGCCPRYGSECGIFRRVPGSAPVSLSLRESEAVSGVPQEGTCPQAVRPASSGECRYPLAPPGQGYRGGVHRYPAILAQVELRPQYQRWYRQGWRTAVLKTNACCVSSVIGTAWYTIRAW